jgi:hypothetical protein
MDARIKSGQDECVFVHTNFQFSNGIIRRHNSAISPRASREVCCENPAL